MLYLHHTSSLAHDPRALAPEHPELAALSGEGDAESIAPDQIVTRRVASHFGHAWIL